MKFIKNFICNYLCNSNLCNKNFYNNNLCINNLHKINNNFFDNNKKILPSKYYSFKHSKQQLFSNNIYFDIYLDSINDYNIYNEKIYTVFKIIKKNKNNKKNKKNNNYINHLNHFNNFKYIKYNSLSAEHIVPQSFLKKYKNAKFDMFNIFLTTNYINSNRSNYKYIDESLLLYINIDTDIKIVYNNYSVIYNLTFYNYNKSLNYKINKYKYFIPYSYNRGIIARSIAYMKYTYDDIILDNIIDINTLKYWNKMYPPTITEKKLNDLIYQLQGNYNIFILNHLLINEYF